MRKIVVKFNKSKDIENLKKIMRNVYASSSDHLPDIAKFHLGDKIFIPNQVDKAELHIKVSFELEHTRHRSIWNAFVHILSTLVAYCMKSNKPVISKNAIPVIPYKGVYLPNDSNLTPEDFYDTKISRK